MESWIVPVVVAVVMSIPGTLSWWRGRNQDESAARAAARQARREQDQTAIDGFARLVEELRKERENDKKDCDSRIRRVEQELLRKIVELETKLEEVGHPV